LCHDFDPNGKILLKCSRSTVKIGNIMLQKNVSSDFGILKLPTVPGRPYFALRSAPIAVDTGFLQLSWRIRKRKYVPGQSSRPTANLFDNSSFYSEHRSDFTNYCVSRGNPALSYPRQGLIPRRKESEGKRSAGRLPVACGFKGSEEISTFQGAKGAVSRCYEPEGTRISSAAGTRSLLRVIRKTAGTQDAAPKTGGTHPSSRVLAAFDLQVFVKSNLSRYDRPGGGDAHGDGNYCGAKTV
jgi:hypothetical protein